MMNSKKLFSVLGVLVVLAAVAVWHFRESSTVKVEFSHQDFFADASRGPASHAGQPKFRRGTVLYKLKDSLSKDEHEKFQRVLGQSKFRTHRKLVQEKIQVAVSDISDGNEQELAQALQETGAVEFAEADRLVKMSSFSPNDPYFQMQWHLQRINATEAWKATHGQARVLVASCDTGVDSTHPDLSPNLALPGYNIEDGSTNSEPINPHGTMTAGTIAAVIDNGMGLAGVSDKVKVLPIKMTNAEDGSSYLSALAECIEYAADHGAKVVNLSFTGGDSYLIDSAAQYLRSKGGLLIMAAGNQGTDMSESPDFDSFVLVGATDSNDQRPFWSNYGLAVDLAAPGDNILSTSMGNTYAWGSGTSLAAPVVAGVAAMIYSLKPTASPEEVENILFNSAARLAQDPDQKMFGYGIVDAGAALKLAREETTKSRKRVAMRPRGVRKNKS